MRSKRTVNKNDISETRRYSDIIFDQLQAAHLPIDLQLSALALTIVEICVANKESRRGVQDLLFAMYEKFIEE